MMRYLFVVITTLFLANISNAQLNISFNLDSQPVWGPTGYDYVENYYLPAIDVYYNVPENRYYFYDSGKRSWIYSSHLPSRYSNYDLYKSYKVVVKEQKPWRNHKSYKNKYSSYKDRHDQKPIRDSRDSKYFVNKGHPEHSKWIKEQKHDNGNNKGKNKKKK
ncbi:MAG: hypothetical protein KKA84_16050 [Bacteroidetes bacterium]|nr:hypothetical protein [Bacteroidota bacterium]